MKKIFIVLALIVLGVVLLSRACSPMYEDDDVIATFRGDDILVRDLKVLYEVGAPAIPEVARNYIFQEAVIYEARELGFEVSEEQVDNSLENFKEFLETYEARRERRFFEDKAEEYGMEYEEYLDVVVREEIEKSLYVDLMEEEVITSQTPEDLNALELADWHDEQFANWYFDTLEKYDDEIEYHFDVEEIEWR
ncbi:MULTISPECIES: hypothetical protein [Bacillaceae]|uniref:SurA-like protein n=1 Tax=Evansella alkalicola TaxID=745819 RepID=A0ABS6JWF4_9BACI|nr:MULTISPECIES: hypothetical protein [Bacillaceae]MBU9722921.1 hypothetical protein [Bacillus alkalicola]